jgi:hypothetical protein
MQKFLRLAVADISTDEQQATFEALYGATFDATPAQLRAILAELDTETGLPATVVDALKRVARAGLGDAAYLAN